MKMTKSQRKSELEKAFSLFILKWMSKYKITDMELLTMCYEHMAYPIAHLKRNRNR